MNALLKPEVMVVLFALLGIPLGYLDTKKNQEHAAKKHKITSEERGLEIAKIAYVTDNLSLLEYEESVEHVLKGGYLDSHGHPFTPVGLPAAEFAKGFRRMML